MARWLVTLDAGYQSVHASVVVEAENMAEAKEKAIEASGDADWEIMHTPFKDEITARDAETI